MDSSTELRSGLRKRRAGVVKCTGRHCAGQLYGNSLTAISKLGINTITDLRLKNMSKRADIELEYP